MSTPSASTEIAALFEQEHRRLYLLALRLVANPAAAEDVVQEAFLRAWRSWSDFRGASSRSTWLCGIVVRCALNMLRSERNERSFVSSETHSIESSTRRPQHEARIDLERAIATLPARARAVFVLRDIEGHAVNEEAQLLDIAPGTVKAHLFHARQRLASLIDHHD